MTLYHRFDVLQSRGIGLAGYQVIVRLANAGAQQPIYSDINGTPIVAVSGIVNAAVTDALGNFSYFVQPSAVYDEEYYTPTGAFAFATRNIPMLVGIPGPAGNDGANGAPGSDLGAIGPFAMAGSQVIPTGALAVRTSGYASTGSGGSATYVKDATATTTLLAANPRAAFQTSDGRIFRLYEPQVTPEMFGAVGDGVTNDQPAIQAALDYCAAVGITKIIFNKPVYAVWAVPRTSPIDQEFARDGHPLVVTSTMSMVSGIANTDLLFFGLNGTNPETTGFSVVKQTASDATATQLWRGGGVFLLGETGVTVPTKIKSFTVENMTWRGQRLRTVTATNNDNYYPATPADPVHHWDLTDKAFWNQDTLIGPVYGRNWNIIGWKGEIFYIGGTGPRLIHLENGTISTTNGDAFNPGGTGRYELLNMQIGDCFQAIEGLAGSRGALMSNTRFFDSLQAFITGAPGNDNFLYNYANPNRDTTKDVPYTVFDNVSFDNVASVLLGCYLRGNIYAVDSPIQIVGANSTLSDVDLDIRAIYDKVGMGQDALTLQGPANLTTQIGGAPPGVYVAAANNVKLRLTTGRTYFAASQGGSNAAWRHDLTGYGYVDPTSVSITIPESVSLLGAHWTQQTDHVPYISMAHWTSTINYRGEDYITGASTSASTQGRITGPRMLLNQSAGNGTYTISLATTPAATGDGAPAYAHGQPARLYHADSRSASFQFASTGAGMILQADRTLSRPGQYLDLVFDSILGLWVEASVGLLLT